nr:hypothetical protein [Tanacetum cinerariifolium]
MSIPLRRVLEFLKTRVGQINRWRQQHEYSTQKIKSRDFVLGALKFSYFCFRRVLYVFFMASLPPNLACMASNKVFASLY